MTINRILLTLAMGFTLFTATLSADVWHRTTVVTFSAPVEVPGAVLPAGKYIFQRLDSGRNRNVLRVMSEDRKDILATFKTYASYHATVAQEAKVELKNQDGASPKDVSLLYPGDHYGAVFMYPKAVSTPSGTR